MMFPQSVRIVEVGPRDGLQNETAWVPTETKVELIRKLAQAGLTSIEATSFVSPKWVPQMRDAPLVLERLHDLVGVRLSVLTPNLQGFERAMAAGAEEVAVFAAASETFSQKNINCSIAESLERFQPILEGARALEIPVRGYLSCVLGCPYEGEVEPQAVVDLAKELIRQGCYEVSLGDTIGRGTPLKARRLVEQVAQEISLEQVALHFHDTRGQALANLYACLDLGVSVVDASVSGLGGCPYARGASGNVATEDVVYMLNGMGIRTGVQLESLIETGRFISRALDRTPQSRVSQASPEVQ
ncbi:MAG: hydroxymethylglutaryl-CoA lyase [bacterium]